MVFIKTLIVVESPTKASTIKNFIKNDYDIIATKGHIRDLSTRGKGGYGVDVEGSFEADYDIIQGKNSEVNKLKKAAVNKRVLIATDPDREGEAIAFHIAEILGLDLNEENRIYFNEITRKAVTNAIENPVKIDQNLVQSQETRRILDRIIGFDLSKLVKSKVGAISAGRVQSVVLKLIVDREKEIQAFIPEDYFLLYADFGQFKASYSKNTRTPIKDRTEAEAIKNAITNPFTISDIDVKEVKRYPAFPYTTSKLQQEANMRYGYNAGTTGSIAQRLFEGVKIKDELVGLITYTRTDSTRLSPEFVRETQNYIRSQYGDQYVGYQRTGKQQVGAQDAHEAIRPTDMTMTPEVVRPFLRDQEFRIYQMIYTKTLAYLMKEGKDEVRSVTFTSNKHEFKQTFTKVLFDGYRTYFKESDEQPILNSDTYKVGDVINAKDIIIEDKQTEPKKRFTEATLIHEMESLGIGRPSTYAETTKRLRTAGYVLVDKRYYSPSALGTLTSDKLDAFFSEIINPNYTSNMEQTLDLIASGESDKVENLRMFYNTFTPVLEKARKEMKREYVKTTPKEVGEMCPVCGKPLVYRRNARAKQFVACSGYPSCTYTRSKK